MEEQHFTTNEIRHLLIGHHAFGSLLVDESSEVKKDDEELGETPMLVKEVWKIETDQNKTKESKEKSVKT
ncbi:hypothetical protein Csa_009183 [Cucumis sativus]|uniref:Uncharacterized protein n=1 Tax=Cucumis sativus TaxID=3659 RepID=A0A0A0KT09_CUCSA|nr:hypothetical protein Csa_009183 [Cucumis sativus]